MSFQFFQITVFDFSPIFGLAVGPFFLDSRPNGVFHISARSESTPILPVFWCLSPKKLKSRFSTLAHFWARRRAVLSSIFGQTVFFIFLHGPRVLRFCLCFGVFTFFKTAIFDLNSTFALAVGPIFHYRLLPGKMSVRLIRVS